MNASDLRSPATCAIRAAHSARALPTPAASRAGRPTRRPGPHVRPSGHRRRPRRVLDDALGRRGAPRRRRPAVPWTTTRSRHAWASPAQVAGLLEDRDRVLGCLERTPAGALVTLVDLDDSPVEDGPRLEPPVPDRCAATDAASSRLASASANVPCSSCASPRSTSSSIRSRIVGPRASATARARRFVAAGRSPRPKARRPAPPSRCAARMPICRPSASIGPSSDR